MDTIEQYHLGQKLAKIRIAKWQAETARKKAMRLERKFWREQGMDMKQMREIDKRMKLDYPALIQVILRREE